MLDNSPHRASEFDEYARSYEQALGQGLAATGEDQNYFARRRIEWLRLRLDALRASAGEAIEFGCGTGSNIPFLIELAGAVSVLGIDQSEQLLMVARTRCQLANVRFAYPADYEPDGKTDLVFCNGVFHHIPPRSRPSALEYVYRCLKPGGLFALWENNPWNPGTRLVMKRIPFDKDAVMITPREAQKLVSATGFEVLRADFLFIFPRLLRFLRPLETLLIPLPVGGQYQLLCRKPSTAAN
jgi:SAM-dependent methyltransferase